MTVSSFAAAGRPGAPPMASSPTVYQPGVCNIGPAEISRRRRAGHIGAVVTVAVLLVLVAVHVPPLVRLIVVLPAAGAAAGYLQAALKFCAGFAARGIFNFGELGTTEQVGDPGATTRDRARANQILVGSLGIGFAVGIVAVLLPL